jgi:hypothetical protein
MEVAMGRMVLCVVSVLMLFVAPPIARAQSRTFLYTMTPLASYGDGVDLRFEAGLGDGSMGFSEASQVDGRIGADWRSRSRWMVSSSVGFGNGDSSFDILSGRVEGLYALKEANGKGWAATAGGGIRWERDGGMVGMFRALGGWANSDWRMEGNLILEKAAESGRDPIDVIISLGWSRRVTKTLSLGVEAVGQDLEGFWEPEEAEGGARILIGPSLHVQLQQWEAGIAGGYNFHPTVSGGASPADRPLGFDRWALQFSLGCHF